MQVVCLDLEGVLVPEIWIEFSKRTGIAELSRTTRDEPDYDKLMRFRIDLLQRHGLKLADIQRVIEGMGPMAGAKDFLDALRARFQVFILSDTFYEFADPLMRQLGRLRVAVDVRRQAAAVEELQGEVGTPFVVADVVDLHDVRMLQTGDCLRLPPEPEQLLVRDHPFERPPPAVLFLRRRDAAEPAPLPDGELGPADGAGELLDRVHLTHLLAVD